MEIRIHPHAMERMTERGATDLEVRAVVESGERFPAKFGRSGFRRNFSFDGTWREKRFGTKQIEVIAAEEETDWMVLTVIVKYF